MSRRLQTSRSPRLRRRLLQLESLEARELLATDLATTPVTVPVMPETFRYLASEEPTIGNYTLRVAGGSLELVDTHDPAHILASRSLAATSNIEIVGQADLNDTLTIDISGGNFALPVRFIGGAGGFDTLALHGDVVEQADYYFTNKTDGRVHLDNLQIAYEGLEPVTSTINATHVTLNYGAGDDAIVVTTAGAQIKVDSTGGETVTFDEGALFEFPRDEHGDVIFCNVEGVAWGGKGLLVTVSDRMKQDQAERCGQCDQSIQVFRIPPEET